MASTSNHSARSGALMGIAALFASVLTVISLSGLVSDTWDHLSDCHDHYDLIAFVVILIILAIALGIAYLGHVGKDQ